MIYAVYGEDCRSGALCVNGFPMFATFHAMNGADVKRFVAAIKTAKKFVETGR